MQLRKRFGLMCLPLLTTLVLGSAIARADTEVGKPALTAWAMGILVTNATGATSSGSLRCNQGAPTQGIMGLDISTVQGQAIYSMLLAATTTGRTVTFTYTLANGQCQLTAAAMTPE